MAADMLLQLMTLTAKRARCRRRRRQNRVKFESVVSKPPTRLEIPTLLTHTLISIV